MKILAIAEFDPAGVLGGHRAALRARGIDYQLAIKDAYRSVRVDFAPTIRPDDTARMLAFAEEADVLQFHPAIGQPWSYSTNQPIYRDGEDEGLFGIAWRLVNPKARRVSYFHGSRNAAVNAAAYAAHWKTRGHAVWVSTLDYMHWMGASYAPPALEDPLPSYEQAKLRERDDPLVVVQAPTDPVNCHTKEFETAVRDVGAVALLLYGRKHEEVLTMKSMAHAGFDHLRGSFSVNTLENCALGLVPLVGLKTDFRETLEGMGVPTDLFPFHDEEGFRETLAKLENDADLTSARQILARRWYETFWRPEVIGVKLHGLYRTL